MIDSLTFSRKGRTTKEQRSGKVTEREEGYEENTEDRENDDEKVGDEEDERAKPREEAAAVQQEAEPERADDVIIIQVIVIELRFRVPVAEVAVAEEVVEVQETICYWTLALDIVSICNLSTHEPRTLFIDADGRCLC